MKLTNWSGLNYELLALETWKGLKIGLHQAFECSDLAVEGGTRH
jgi:hypothetical protein